MSITLQSLWKLQHPALIPNTHQINKTGNHVSWIWQFTMLWFLGMWNKNPSLIHYYNRITRPSIWRWCQKLQWNAETFQFWQIFISCSSMLVPCGFFLLKQWHSFNPKSQPFSPTSYTIQTKPSSVSLNNSDGTVTRSIDEAGKFNSAYAISKTPKSSYGLDKACLTCLGSQLDFKTDISHHAHSVHRKLGKVDKELRQFPCLGTVFSNRFYLKELSCKKK